MRMPSGVRSMIRFCASCWMSGISWIAWRSSNSAWRKRSSSRSSTSLVAASSLTSWGASGGVDGARPVSALASCQSSGGDRLLIRQLFGRFLEDDGDAGRGGVVDQGAVDRDRLAAEHAAAAGLVLRGDARREVVGDAALLLVGRDGGQPQQHEA